MNTKLLRDSKILHFSKFNTGSAGHGGNRRTSQIMEMLVESGLQFKSLNFGLESFKSKPTSIKVIKSIFHYLLFTLKVKKIYTINPKNLLKVGYLFYEVRKNKSLYTDTIFLLENTVDEAILIPLMLKLYSVKCICIPHNIESLVPKQHFINNQKSPYWFYKELKLLNFANTVYTISYEEYWLLKSFSLKVDWLPYYPPKTIYESCINIRKRRSELNFIKTDIFILGSVGNHPTYLGIKKLLDFFVKNPISNKILVGGYKTESFFEEYNNVENIKVLGTLSEETLSELLITSKCVLINNNASSGALTKVSELLISGVPILINAESARSYLGSDGLYCYYNFQEMLAILNFQKLGIPKIPDRPEGNIQRLLIELNN
jgi:hypothetical protein